MGLGLCILYQKMVDVVIEVLFGIMECYLCLQVVILGCGDYDYEVVFFDLVECYCGCIVVYIGYDECCVYVLYVGSDMLLYLICFEFFGLIFLYVMCYGVIFIGLCVGGLVDIVCDVDCDLQCVIGVLFEGESVVDMQYVVICVFVLYNDIECWQSVQCNVMSIDCDWVGLICVYIDVYVYVVDMVVCLLFVLCLLLVECFVIQVYVQLECMVSLVVVIVVVLVGVVGVLVVVVVV